MSDAAVYGRGETAEGEEGSAEHEEAGLILTAVRPRPEKDDEEAYLTLPKAGGCARKTALALCACGLLAAVAHASLPTGAAVQRSSLPALARAPPPKGVAAEHDDSVPALAPAPPSEGAAVGHNAVDDALSWVEGMIQEDQRHIDELFQGAGCRHVFLDVGSNIGVQIRKLYEPGKYKGALFPPLFRRLFGPEPHCGVCSVGFEPNPLQSQRLTTLQQKLREAGARVLILNAAAAVVDGKVQFATFFGNRAFEHWSANMQLAPEFARGAEHTYPARSVDLPRLILLLSDKLRARAGEHAKIIMKLDIEAGEFVMLAPLLLTGAICKVDWLVLEEHARKLCQGGKCQWKKAWAEREIQSFSRAVAAAHKKALCRAGSGGEHDESFLHDNKSWPNGTICPGQPLGLAPVESAAAPKLFEAFGTLSDSEELQLDRLFTDHRCIHAFVDFGAQAGQLVRELFEPSRYPASELRPLFEEYFGPAPRCRVCVVALESNPEHSKYLAEVEEGLRKAGAGILVLRAAGAAIRGSVQAGLWGGARGSVVRTVDASRLLSLVSARVQAEGGKMLLNVDAGELNPLLLPPLIMRAEVCKCVAIRYRSRVPEMCSTPSERCLWVQRWMNASEANFALALSEAAQEVKCRTKFIAGREAPPRRRMELPKGSVCE